MTQMALAIMKVLYKKLKTKTIKYRTWSYKPFSNEAFMVNFQRQWQRYVRQNMSPKKSKTKQLKKVVSENQVSCKSGRSEKAIAKTFHFVLILRISTAHSYNADFILTDNQVKNALTKVYHDDKEQKRLSSNL